jgi:thiol-disulfide isomerase/thioredoxin
VPFLTAVAASALLLAAALKAADRPGTVVSLATYGLDGRAASLARLAAIAAEVAVAAGLLAGSRAAAVAGAALLGAFALAQAGALAAGRAGAPCGCLGGRGRLSWFSAARTAALAAALAALTPAADPRATAAALAAAAAGAWLLHPRRPAGALDVAGEGPEIGSRLELPGEGARLAVFTSPDCGLCRDLRPSLGRIERKAQVEVLELAAADFPFVPGAPYAVMIGPSGEVLAKGAVNTARQLRSLIPRAADPERRAFLRSAAGAAATVSLAPAVGSLVKPGEAEAFHFCGHIYTTDSCPHPTGLPRIDAKGLPLRAKDGLPVDDLGRLIDAEGNPVDEDGARMVDPDGRPFPAATRTAVCTATGRQYGFPVRIDGAWYRCCGGRVRKLVDCCSEHPRRINGDRALKGYCYKRRKVFCVMYFQTKVPC